MPDYTQLIDEETWSFIRKTAEFYPDDAVTRSIEEQRQVYDQMCRALNAGRPDSVTTQDVFADDVPVRVYTCGAPNFTAVYFHGGGFVVGGLESHDDVCAELCVQTGYRVVAVDYRLSPEHVHPAAFDDAWSATLWAIAEFEGPVVLVGDSAGGNLVAAVSHAARGRTDKIHGQVLIYPGLGGDNYSGSYLTHAEAPMLTRDDVLFYMSIRHGGPAPTGDATASPLQDTDFSGLPPSIIFTAECDPLSDDGKAYCDKVKAAGGKAAWIEEEGLVHGYLRARKMSKRAGTSFDRITTAVEALGQDLWPY